MLDAVIVGSGFAGLGAAVRLDRAGRPDFVVLEKGESLGGTWRDNAYPGCACDIESHLYSFSFFPNPDWTRTFARQAEIRAYLEATADRFGLRDRIRFGAQVTSAEWDGGAWEVRTADGTTLRARAVLFGTGALHEPLVPELPGLDAFRGTVFHSARWDHGHDLRGKRVAVVGTGASAIQFVPAIAPETAHLTLFQRTAPWVLPKPDRPIPEGRRRLFRRFPLLQRLQRYSLYWRHELVVAGFRHPALLRLAQRAVAAHLRRTLRADPELRRQVTPDFTLGCKRILLSGDYYPALLRDDVSVETTPIARVAERGIVTADGVEHEADTIVFGTGFRVAESMAAITVTGRDGRKLADAWADGPEAFLGTTVAGFPNLFLLVGPNTGLGHSSMVLMIESQLAYVLDALRTLDTHRATAIDTRPQVQEAYNAGLRRELARTVWSTGGCASWYLDERGRNHTLWPGYTAAFRRRTRRVSMANHTLLQ